jgi:ankyrin repeat protein
LAVQRFRDVYPGDAPPKLREVQHALSHEFGFASWAILKQEVEDRVRSHAQRVELFLEKGVHRYGTDPRTGKWGAYERDGAARGALAARLLAKHPEIARENIHTAVLAHDIETVREFLTKDPSLANDMHPFDGWRPLARLCYARLPLPAAEANALPIATMLLDAGASAQSAGAEDMKGFTNLTGAIGGGEAGQSAHPQAESMVRLLIMRGADPLDGQAMYDTSLGEDDTFWLDLMWTECEKRGDDTAARWHIASPGVIGPPLEYLLGNAVPNHPRRVAWLLEHGADANTNNFYSKEPVIRHASVAGRQDIVDLLVRHGAQAPQLSEPERFLAAASQGNIEGLKSMAQAHPALLKMHAAMFAAIKSHRLNVAEALLDLGMSPDVGDEKDFRALHQTTHAGAIEIARLLIARGAQIDAIERRYNSTALGHAMYQGRTDMVALLAPLSRDIASLCWSGSMDRLRELLREDPSLANKPGRWGEPPLFCLPDEDEMAVEIVEILLTHGADRMARNKEGLTPQEAALKRGFEDTAAILAP